METYIPYDMIKDTRSVPAEPGVRLAACGVLALGVLAFGVAGYAQKPNIRVA